MCQETEWGDGRSPLQTPYARDERAKLRGAIWIGICRAVTFAACVAALAGILALYSRGVIAEEIPVYVYEDQVKTVRLMPGSCVDGRSTMIFAASGPEYMERLRALESNWLRADGERRDYAGCWLELSAEESGADETVLVLVFADGERFVVPKSLFVQQKGRGA